MSDERHSPYLDRGEHLLNKMNAKVPWQELVDLLEPYYPADKKGFRNFRVENMLRVYCLSKWLKLCYDVSEQLESRTLFRDFAGLTGSPVPSDNIINHFNNILYKHQDILRLVDQKTSVWDDFKLPAYLTAYPEPEQIFAQPTEKYARHLLPLASIDLKAVNPNWSGNIHIVNPIDIDLVENTSAFHNYYLRHRWIAFHLTDDSRFELMGDWRYFFLENEPSAELTKDLELWPTHRQDLEDQYTQMHADYQACKRRYQKEGDIVLDRRNYFFEEYPEDYPLNDGILEQFAGEVASSCSNWFSFEPFPYQSDMRNVGTEAKPCMQETNIRPLAEDGSPFHFIAQTYAHPFMDIAERSVILFFEPKNRITLLTFECS